MKRIVKLTKFIVETFAALMILGAVFLWNYYMVGSAIIVALHWSAFILLSIVVVFFVK